MSFLNRILSYWPILAASTLFLALGLWWYLSASAAMERTPKSIKWVKNYRSGAFPFRRELLGEGRPGWWALLLALLVGAAFAVWHFFNSAMYYQLPLKTFLGSFYGISRILLFALGAGAVCWLLYTLFSSTWVALPGALIFAASAARGHAESCFLALSLLLLVLYLRSTKPGFPAELLYFCAVLALAPMLAMRSALVWVLPAYPIVHWYKLISHRRAQRLGGGGFILSLLLALFVWALTALLTVALFRFLIHGFRLEDLGAILSPKRILVSARLLLRFPPRALLTVPTRGMTVDLMVDAPLYGFGFWGCFAAWTLARSRRDVRGVFALTVLAVLLLTWLLTSCYAMTLGLTMSTACILWAADLGRKRWLSVLMTVLGLLWYVGIQAAAWYFPLTKGLIERLI